MVNFTWGLLRENCRSTPHETCEPQVSPQNWLDTNWDKMSDRTGGCKSFARCPEWIPFWCDRSCLVWLTWWLLSSKSSWTVVVCQSGGLNGWNKLVVKALLATDKLGNNFFVEMLPDASLDLDLMFHPVGKRVPSVWQVRWERWFWWASYEKVGCSERLKIGRHFRPVKWSVFWGYTEQVFKHDRGRKFFLIGARSLKSYRQNVQIYLSSLFFLGMALWRGKKLNIQIIERAGFADVLILKKKSWGLRSLEGCEKVEREKDVKNIWSAN